MMNLQTLLLSLAMMATANAFATKTLPAFRTSHRASITMDMEGTENSHMFIPSVKQQVLQEPFSKLQVESPQERLRQVDAEEQRVDMPWDRSIDENLDNDALLYMPFWDWQLKFLKENLTNLRVISCTDQAQEHDFSLKTNKKKGARIVNLCLASDEYRKIRMTYYDAGKQTQVFNSLWYPRACYNAPVLGIDLLQFNQKKHLAVVDFQPIQTHEKKHARAYEHLLEPIRQDYPSLQGKMSARFYDEAQFFSNQMLFARFESPQVVTADLLPAFQRYCKAHVDLIKATPPNFAESLQVLERQAAYDLYSAERDPATAMFERMFGTEWADKFVHEFLFSMSRTGV